MNPDFILNISQAVFSGFSALFLGYIAWKEYRLNLKNSKPAELTADKVEEIEDAYILTVRNKGKGSAKNLEFPNILLFSDKETFHSARPDLELVAEHRKATLNPEQKTRIFILKEQIPEDIPIIRIQATTDMKNFDIDFRLRDVTKADKDYKELLKPNPDHN